MAYGKKYKFVFDSQNGSKIDIYILEKNYLGNIITRSLGRAPVLKRENNNCVYGTSLEMFAECQVDGEFAALYTSSADQYKVEVYKNDNLIWVGFISPELYSEPDVAPPYDVQIIATDGLGELRRSELSLIGEYTISYYIQKLLQYTNLDLDLQIVSDFQGEAYNALELLISLDKYNGVSCYDVLQKLLASMHAIITQQGGKWFLFRETDLDSNITSRGLSYVENSTLKLVSIPTIGSQQYNKWWPIGKFSNTIEAACNRVELSTTSSYRNAYNNWEIYGNLVSYNEADNSYTLANAENLGNKQLGGISQLIMPKHDIEWSILLRFNASLYLSSSEEDTSRKLGMRIEIKNQNGATYYYRKTTNGYAWTTGSPTTVGQPWSIDLNTGEQDIEILLPFHNTDRYQFYATQLLIEISRHSRENGDIVIRNLEIVAGDQYPNIDITGRIVNNAREESSQVDILFPSSYALRNTSNPQDMMYTVPKNPVTKDYIKEWSRSGNDARDYSHAIIRDYAESVAYPRLKVTGKINVPQYDTLPLLFNKDGIYLIVQNYSYDLLADEVDVTLISIPNAIVEVEEVKDIPASSPSGSTSSGSASSGGGASGAEISGIYQEIERLSQKLDSSDEYVEDLAVEMQRQDALIWEEIRDIDSRLADTVGKEEYAPQLSVGLADNLAGRGEAIDAEITFRASGGGSIEDGNARIESIRGNSVVWNQQFPALSSSHYLTNDSRTSFAYSGRAATGTYKSSGLAYLALRSSNSVANHIYFISAEIYVPKTAEIKLGWYGGQTSCGTAAAGSRARYSLITKATKADSALVGFTPASGWASGDTFTIANIQCVDLTKMFGAGNEPATIASALERFPLNIDAYDYNAGEIFDMKVQGIKSVGFNAFDGEKALVIGGKQYYLGGDYEAIDFEGTDITIPSNKLYTPPYTGYIYAEGADICVNLVHSGYRNGEYEPYTEYRKNLPIIAAEFVNGMRKAGDAYDEIYYDRFKRKWYKVQRVGARAYQSGDENVVGYVTDSVTTYHTLAEPIVTELENIDTSVDYEVWDFGTEQALASEPSAPFNAGIVYGFNAVDKIRENAAEIANLKAMLLQLQTALAATEISN